MAGTGRGRHPPASGVRAPQQARFERLLGRLSRQDRRIIAALLRRLAALDARGEHAQALRLIEQVQGILEAPDSDA